MQVNTWMLVSLEVREVKCTFAKLLEILECIGLSEWKEVLLGRFFFGGGGVHEAVGIVKTSLKHGMPCGKLDIIFYL